MPVLSLDAVGTSSLCGTLTALPDRRKRMHRAWRARSLRPKPTASRVTACRGVPSYAAQAKVGKVDGFAVAGGEQAEARRHRRRCRARLCLSGHRCGFVGLPAVARAQRRRGRGDPPLASLRRRRPSGRSGWRRPGLVALMFANTPARDRALGRIEGGVRHQPDRLRLPRCPGRAPIVVDLSLSKVARGNIMAARQQRRENPGRLGARRPGPADDRSRRGLARAPCCRSATPRERRWR